MITRKGGLLAGLVPMLFGTAVSAQEEGRFIVQLRDQVKGRAAVMARGHIVLALGPQRALAATLPEEAIEGLRRHPAIESVERDVLRYPLGQVTPYGIEMVQAPEAWAGASATARRVCVIDSGRASDHEDLQGIDVSGYPSNWNRDGCSHGTHVTGTIAALNNDRGVVGVLPNGANLYVVRVFDDSCRWIYVSGLVDALNRCINAGANIVSMSLGGPLKSLTEERAFSQAWEAGILSVAAAGNRGTTELSYPASYDSVISVAAVDSTKKVAGFSQHNAQVELAAPGVGGLSTVATGGYEAWNGTSMATPHVSGVAALVWSHNPAWSNAQIRAALRATAEDLGPSGRDDYYGYGLVQARAALDYLGTVQAPPTASFTWTCEELSCRFTDTSTDSDGTVTAWSWNFAGLGTSSLQHPSFSFRSAGSYLVELRVTDNEGASNSVEKQVAVTSSAPIAIELSATGYKVRGKPYVDLDWRGATGEHVEVYRNGKLVATTANDGAYTDAIEVRKGGTYEYRVCEQGSAVCSNTAAVVF